MTELENDIASLFPAVQSLSSRPQIFVRRDYRFDRTGKLGNSENLAQRKNSRSSRDNGDGGNQTQLICKDKSSVQRTGGLIKM